MTHRTLPTVANRSRMSHLPLLTDIHDILLPVRVQHLPVVAVRRCHLEMLNLEVILCSEFTTQSQKQHDVTPYKHQYPLYVSLWIQTRVFHC